MMKSDGMRDEAISFVSVVFCYVRTSDVKFEIPKFSLLQQQSAIYIYIYVYIYIYLNLNKGNI